MSNDTQEFSLTKAQQRLWVLDKFDRVPYLYNVPLMITLPPRIDFDRLQKAFNYLIQQHPQLSVSFDEKEEKVVQTYHPEITIDFLHIELDGAIPDIVDIEHYTSLANFFLRPFHLTESPLLRLAIAKSNETYYLCVSCHHLIIDAWSFHLMLNKLNQLYLQLAKNEIPALDRSESYFNYVTWEQNQLAADCYASQLTYWEKRLQNKSWVVDLISDYSRRKYLSGVGSNQTITLSDETYQYLRRYAREHQLTANHIILSAFQLLLGRYSGQDDIYLGIPIANRHQRKWLQTIGLFVNTLVHTCKIDYRLHFHEHVQKTKLTLLQDISHANVPYDDLLSHFYQNKLCSQGISFNILYNFIQLSSQKENESDLSSCKTLFCLLPVSKFDLSFHILMSDTDLTFLFEYSTELFSKKTIQQLLDHLQMLLMTLMTNDKKPIAKLLWVLNNNI